MAGALLKKNLFKAVVNGMVLHDLGGSNVRSRVDDQANLADLKVPVIEPHQREFCSEKDFMTRMTS
jgi:hypothetical protein